MSATIKAAITALRGRIAAAYSAISAKGGTLPATQDSANLPSAIATIPSGGGGFDTSICKGFDYLFYYYSGDKPDLSELKTNGATLMRHMFDSFWRTSRGNIGDGIIDISHFDTSHVTSMEEMFAYSAYGKTLFYLGTNWNTSNVTNMSGAFRYALIPNPLIIDTSNVTNFSWMFYEADEFSSLTDPNYKNKWDLSHLSFASATNVNYILTYNSSSTLIYGHTLAEVEAGTCVLFKDLKISCDIHWSPLDYMNMLACAKGVKDLTGGTTQTFKLHSNNFNALTQEQQTTIQTEFSNKNWTLALA